MAFQIISDEQHEWLYQAESTFGTPIALNDTNYKGVFFEKANLPEYGVTRDNLDLNRASRFPTLADHYIDNYSTPPSLRFTQKVTLDRLSDFIFACLQNRVSQGAVGTGYQKVFRPHASQPDFTANAGYFFTLIRKEKGLSGKDLRFTSCIIPELDFTFTKESPGQPNIGVMSGLIIAKKMEIEQTFTGSGAAAGGNYILAHQLAADLTLGTTGGDVQYVPNWASFSVSIRSNAVPLDKDANGNPITFFIKPTATASLKVWWNSDSVNAINTLRSGGSVILTMTKGTNNVAGHVKFSLRGQITNNPQGVENNLMTVPLELDLGNSTAGATDGLDLTISDAISQ
jgi:hypothetical protein